MVYRFKLIESSLQQLSKLIFYQKTTYMDKRQKNNLMTTITLIVVLGQFILQNQQYCLDLIIFIVTKQKASAVKTSKLN